MKLRACLLLLCAGLLFAGTGVENVAFRELTADGLAVSGDSGFRVKLPSPLMSDGLPAGDQRRVIKRVAGPRRRLEHLLRDSIVAPFVLKISELPGPRNAAPLRSVNVSYVAYGSLEWFTQPEFFLSMIDVAAAEQGDTETPRVIMLDQSALASRGLEVANTADHQEFFLHSNFELFDRVALQATRRVEISSAAESVTIAALIDGRFTDDDRYPNQWRSLPIAARGQTEAGEPQPYATSGSYTKVTRLKEPVGALFIEHHHVFAEPEGWFEGKNLLRSKLPLAVQRSVRKLRRRLKERQASTEQEKVPDATRRN